MKLAILTTAAALCCAFGSGDAAAYCVYNKADKPAHFGALGGPSFSKTVQPGAKECCVWNEVRCNKKKSRTSKTQLATTIETGGASPGAGSATHGYRCGAPMGQGSKKGTEAEGYGYRLEGGGAAELYKNGDGYEVRVYDSDYKSHGALACTKF